jgi:hypothetical protein
MNALMNMNFIRSRRREEADLRANGNPPRYLGGYIGRVVHYLVVRSLVISHSALAVGPTLTGSVLDTNNTPVAGATVFIYSAGPRIGTSSFCPTCYADCKKNDVTDAKGAFSIEELDPTLIFRLLVVNKNYRPLFVRKIDPMKGPIQIKIEPRAEEAPPHQSLRGRILDPTGKPVPRAVVEFDFFGGQEANCGGQCDGVDLVAVTDEEGRFFIGSEKKFDWMTIRVEAPLFARKKFFRLSSERLHELKLGEGAMVTGHITENGKPAKGIGVGLVSVDRSDNFTGNYDTYTDDEGHFAFLNVPPYQMYYVYSRMDSSKDDLVAPLRKVRVTGDGTKKDVGDMPLTKGVRLKGKVLLSDGKPIPPDTRVYVGREGAWDSRNIILDPDGSFDLAGIPIESISLGVTVPGYFMSEKNKSLDRLNGGTIVGRVESDTFVTILLEPGKFQHPDFDKRPPGIDWIPKDKPLQGIAADGF